MSARDYSKVSPFVWDSRRFRGLSSITVKFTLFYMLTSKHVNSSGCYLLPDAYACADLGLTLDQYITARAELIQAGMIVFDEATSEVLIDLWFKHNPPMNPDHMTGTSRQLEFIDSPTLRQIATERLEIANNKRIEVQEAKKAKKKAELDRAAAEKNLSNVTGLSRLDTDYLKRSR